MTVKKNPTSTKKPTNSPTPTEEATTSPIPTEKTTNSPTPKPSVSSNPTDTSEKEDFAKNEQDVATLKKIIAEQRERGATIIEDLNNESVYTWENGRLIEIYWRETNLSGNLDVSDLTNLTSLNCYGNELTSLDVANLTNLTYLDCHNNQLTSLDITNNTELEDLRCSRNQLTSLDVTNNTKLKNLGCDDTVIVTGYKGD